jgi:hypothetical protein
MVLIKGCGERDRGPRPREDPDARSEANRLILDRRAPNPSAVGATRRVPAWDQVGTTPRVAQGHQEQDEPPA